MAHANERKPLQPVPRPSVNGAPATATFLVLGLIGTLSIYLLGLRHWDTEVFLPPGLSSVVPAVFRLFLSVFAFRYPGEAIFAWLMLYYFQTVEKQMGTRKFLPFAVFVTLVQQVLQYTYGHWVRSLPLTKSGLYGVAFAALAIKVHLEPTVKHRLVGCTLSQKQMSLLMAAFLVLNDFLFDLLFNHKPDVYLFGRSKFSVSGLMAAVFGYTAGLLYLLPALGPVERWLVLPSSRNPLVVWLTLIAHQELETVPYHLQSEHMRLLEAAYNPVNW
jgi:membrane associated rhomboid family serine protease